MTEGAINSSLKYKQLILRLSEVVVRLKVCVSNGNVEKATKRRETPETSSAFHIKSG